MNHRITVRKHAMLAALVALPFLSGTGAARDGDLSTDFGAQVVIPAQGNLYSLGVCVDSADRVIVSGYRFILPTPPGGKDFFAARLRPDGSADPDFGIGGQSVISFDRAGANDDLGTRCAVTAGDRALIVGAVETNPAAFDFGFVELLADGSPNSAFGDAGRFVVPIDAGGVSDQAVAVLLEPGGRILAAGQAQTATGSVAAIVRLLPGGTRDNTFDLDGRATIAFDPGNPADTAFADAIAEDSLGRVIVAGASDGDFAIARLTADGAPDTTFNGSGIVRVPFDLAGDLHDQAEAVLVQSDGRIVAAGHVCSGGPSSCLTEDIGVVRVEADGSLDATFGQGGRRVISLDRGGSNEDRAFAALQQSDGKLLIVGSVTVGASEGHAVVVRLRPDGTRDTGFGTDGVAIHGIDNTGEFSELATSAAFDSAGQIVIGGLTTFAPTGALYGFAMRLDDGDDIFTDGFETPL